MANTHNSNDDDWELFFDLEAYYQGQGPPPDALERTEDQQLNMADVVPTEGFYPESRPVRGLQQRVLTIDPRLLEQPLGTGHQSTPPGPSMPQPSRSQALPDTWSSPDMMPPADSEMHFVNDAMEQSASSPFAEQLQAAPDPQLPLHLLTLAQAGVPVSERELRSNTFKSGVAAAVARAGTVRLEDDYDDFAAVKQNAKHRVKSMLAICGQPVSDQVLPTMPPELFTALQRYCYQEAVILPRKRDQYHAESSMYLLLQAVTDANRHGPRVCKVDLQPNLQLICSQRLQRCMDLMAADWAVRLQVLGQLELSSFAASPDEYAKAVRMAAVADMQAREAMRRG